MSLRVPLPTPNGDAELERALDAMESLRFATMRELLRASEGDRNRISRYHLEAPDSISVRCCGERVVAIGDRMFTKLSPDEPWEVTDYPGEPFSWPEGFYRDFYWGDGVAVRVLGRERVNGEPSLLLALTRPDIKAWFRLWVGIEDGIVHRMEMRADGHIMDWIATSFDKRLDVRPSLRGGQ